MKFLPDIKQIILDNGMAIYVVERPEQPAVEIECHVRTGSIHEEEYLGCGLSHFLEHMMFQGCRDYVGTAASDRLSAMGGAPNAYTSFDKTVYYCELPKRYWQEGTEILSKMVRYPEFPEERFKSEREVILRECELGRDEPMHRLQEQMLQSSYLRHPIRVPIIGYKDKIATVNYEMMHSYYKRRYAPNRIFWVIVGAVTAVEVFEKLNSFCGDWEHGNLFEPNIIAEPAQITPRDMNIYFADPLARIGISGVLPGSAHADIPAIDVMCGVLGMSSASRLSQKIKQEQELAIDISSFGYVQSFGGLLGIVAVASPERVEKLQSAINFELDLVRKKGFKAKEVVREQTQQYAEQLRQLRNNSGIAQVISSGIYGAGSPRFAELYLERLSKLSRDEVNAVATNYLDEQNLSTIKMLPESSKKSAKSNSKSRGIGTPVESTLVHGVKFIYIEDRSLPLIDCVITLPGGTIWEGANERGISALLVELLDAGCSRYSEAEFCERVEELGANMSMSSGSNSFSIYCNVPSRNINKFMELLKAMFEAPSFDEQIFLREQHNSIEELESRLQKPRFVANRKALELAYGAHPYSAGRYGNLESLKALKVDDVKRFYSEICVPNQCVFGFAGDLSLELANSLAIDLAQVINWSPVDKELPKAPKFFAESLYEEVELEREQTVVNYCIKGGSVLDDNSWVFLILAEALNGLSSVLFKSIREDNALAYSTGMQQFSGWHAGLLNFFAITTAERADEALTMLKREVERIGRVGLSSSEFEEARRGAIFNLERMLSSSNSLLNNLAISAFYGKDMASVLHEIKVLREVTIGEVNDILYGYLFNVPAITVVAGRLNQGE